MRRLVFVFLIAAFLCGCSSEYAAENDKIINKELTPTYGGTLKIYSYNSDTLNPLYTQNKANAQMLMLVFDTLIKCDENMKPIPVLATGYEVSSDGLLWTVGIRSGVIWHDGTPLTSADVAETLNAVMKSTHSSPYKNNLANAVKIEAFEGFVRIILSKPQTNFISLLEIPIVKAESVNTYDDFNPIGTGLYAFAQRTKKILYLSSNNSRWDEAMPYITSVEVHLMPDKDTAVYAFNAREIDVISTNLQSRGKFSGSSESKSVSFGSGRFSFLALNLNNKYLSDIRVRTAIAHAINKKRIFEEVLLSHGVLTDSCINPKWWMYNNSVKSYIFDQTLAITTLNDAGIMTKDIKFDILVNDDNKIKLQTAEIVSQGLKEIGINAQIKPVAWDSFLRQISTGTYDMYIGEINYSNEVDPKYALQNSELLSDAVNRLQFQIDDEGRKAVYDEIQQEYASLLPSLPLYFEDETLLLSGRINGSIKPQRSNAFSGINEWFIAGD